MLLLDFCLPYSDLPVNKFVLLNHTLVAQAKLLSRKEAVVHPFQKLCHWSGSEGHVGCFSDTVNN